MATTSNQPINPDDSLPPVEPPSAAFLVQLFLVPGVIVAIIVCVWLAFHWLAHLGNDPQAYVRTLRRANEGRWQAALNLANDLRGPNGSGLKADVKLASELGSILDDEVGSGRTGEQSETLRLYLCRALGEFSVPEAAPALVRRVNANDDEPTTQAAIEAIAVLATNLQKAGRSFENRDDVVAAVLAATTSANSRVRDACGFTLGVLGGERSIDGLLRLVGDPSADVRSNAALGLARLGQPDAYDTLSEMLALEDVYLDEKTPDDKMQSERYKRALVVVNALRGITMLIDATNEGPPSGIIKKIEELQQDSVAEVRSSAKAVIKKIDRLAG
ncbi:MAG: HEAT repeat domain-containing protein [Pirellulales bacterium]|jgi:HEAT repeat protein|nr:HEAT repeat domain-containing protein [Pirellulales bacterium]